MYDEAGSAKAGALLNINVAQSFAHEFECCNIPCRSVSVQVPYHTSPLRDSARSILWLPTKDEHPARSPFCPQPGVLEAALPMYCPTHVDDRTYWLSQSGLEPAFPFRDVEQVPCAFSRDPPEDDRYLDC